MTYSRYADKINEHTSDLNDLITNISSIDFESSWEGTAFTKQISDLKKLINENDNQITYLNELSAVLVMIDEYDSEKKLAREYEININNLNTQDPDYQQDVDRINSLKRKAIEAYESLRTQINNKLSNISTRYSEQYVDIPATPVENTVSVFEKAEQSLSSIPEMLTIQPANGDVIRSKNAGTIQLDKQGTYYDTEPTPGKSAQKLHVYHNGERLYDDACITIKKGETIRLTVNLSDNAGNVELLKRTSADGYRDENNPNNSWPNFFSAYSEPSVNRYDSSTYLATDHYDWVITADKVTNGYVTLSQTTFHSTENAPEYKSMYRIKVKVVE